MTPVGQRARLEAATSPFQSLRPKAAMLMKPEVLRRALSDARSGQVVFVSHCMLNQNVRYQGGATRPGAVDEVVARLQRAGVGIVQMPCPEQRAWGGVDKRYTHACLRGRLHQDSPASPPRSLAVPALHTFGLPPSRGP